MSAAKRVDLLTDEERIDACHDNIGTLQAIESPRFRKVESDRINRDTCVDRADQSHHDVGLQSRINV